MDIVDRMNEQWREVLPELDPSPLDIVGRVIVLAEYLERSVGEALAPHGLSLGQYDILATLRRSNQPGLTPTALMKSVMLTSGGMTSRIDRLEEMGLIQRGEDPDDRRGVVVMLTRKGRQLIDQATATRFAEARQSLPQMSSRELRDLADLLRKWLMQIQSRP